MSKTLWIIGGGSGMGRATAITAAQAGWRIAITGRRAEAVSASAGLVRDLGGNALELPADARDSKSLAKAHEDIVAQWGPVTAVVLAAGLNTPGPDLG